MRRPRPSYLTAALPLCLALLTLPGCVDLGVEVANSDLSLDSMTGASPQVVDTDAASPTPDDDAGGLGAVGDPEDAGDSGGSDPECIEGPVPGGSDEGPQLRFIPLDVDKNTITITVGDVLTWTNTDE